MHIVDHLMNKEPELRDLLTWLDDIAYLWYGLGQQLMVSDGTLKKINQGQGGSKFSEVFNKWDTGLTSPHTFRNLCTCLENLKQWKYANKLKQELRNPKVYARYSSKPDFDH